MDKLRGEALSAADAAGNQVKDHQTTSTATRETKNVSLALPIRSIAPSAVQVIACHAVMPAAKIRIRLS
jgi:hypothetical protein